jgi:hypothetical protein
MVGFEPTVCGLGDRCQFHSDRIPLVGEVGFAPTTSCVSDRRSTPELFPNKLEPHRGLEPRTPVYKTGALPDKLRWLGYGTRIRTQITRSRAACPTVERYRSG